MEAAEDPATLDVAYTAEDTTNPAQTAHSRKVSAQT